MREETVGKRQDSRPGPRLEREGPGRRGGGFISRSRASEVSEVTTIPPALVAQSRARSVVGDRYQPHMASGCSRGCSGTCHQDWLSKDGTSCPGLFPDWRTWTVLRQGHVGLGIQPSVRGLEVDVITASRFDRMSWMSRNKRGG